MPWPMIWNGVERDYDPVDFSTRELSEINRVAGFDGLSEIVEAIRKSKPDVFRALFWTVDRRENPDLRFGDYDGPSMRVIITQIGRYDDSGLGPDGDEPGKEPPASTTDGSPTSPNDSDTPDATTTS